MRTSQPRRGFTLTELMAAVLILVVVISAVGQIFGSFTRAASLGEANASVIQQAVAIERRMRDDLAGLTRAGPMAIRCVEVRNDINRLLPSGSGGNPNAPLLDPGLAADARLRLDQLVFFTTTRQATTRFAGSYDLSDGEDSYGNHQSMLGRVYYGHGVQMPNDPGAIVSPVLAGGTTADRLSYDPVGFDWGNLMPWSYDAAPGDLDIRRWPEGTAVGTKIDGSQPGAGGWVLARQAVMCADDFGRSNFYSVFWNENGALDPHLNNSAPLWNSAALWSGRVDICAESPEELREYWLANGVSSAFHRLMGGTGGGAMAALTQLRYPRVERTAPTGDDEDQMLSASALSPNCLSFEIDWTWADETGAQYFEGDKSFGTRDAWVDANGNNSFDNGESHLMRGFLRNPWDPDGMGPMPVRMTTHRGQVWFGLPAFGLGPTGAITDPDPASTISPPDRGVRTLETADVDAPPVPTGNGLSGPGLASVNWPIAAPGNLEDYDELRLTAPSGGSVAALRVYSVFFGFNTDEPLVVAQPSNAGQVTTLSGTPYTPYPRALRVTMRISDPDNRLQSGRVYQCVLDIPEQRDQR